MLDTIDQTKGFPFILKAWTTNEEVLVGDMMNNVIEKDRSGFIWEDRLEMSQEDQ